MVFTHQPPVTDSSFSCSFRVRHGYPPSSSNNWQVAFLAKFSSGSTSGETASGIIEGLVLGVNLTGSDDRLALWQLDEGKMVEICKTSLNYQEEAGTEEAPLVSLYVDKEGQVSIRYSGGSGSADFPVWTGQLISRPVGRQLVVRYQYSSAQDRKLWIDDLRLSGTFEKDTLPPRIDSVEVTDGEMVRIGFSEPLHQAVNSSFRLQWPGGDWKGPVSCGMEGERQVVAEFDDEIPNREWMRLAVTDICDRDGNCLSDTVVQVRRNEPEWGDIIFSEIMADPDPQVKLPGEEYLELYNRSGEQLDLTNWQLAVNGRVYRLSNEQVATALRLAPGAYMMVTGIVLPNEEGEVVLLTAKGTLIHAARYNIPWQGPGWKQEGGWSLENPDPDRLCGAESLWGYSEDPQGGTPGRINSLHTSIEDKEPPLLLFAGFNVDRSVFSVYFSETVRYSHWVPSHFPLIPDDQLPERVAPSWPLSDRIDLTLPAGMRGKAQFSVKLPFLVDCSGNICHEREAAGGIPTLPSYGSVVINEVMFAPREGAPEYIELLNTGQTYCDLRDLGLSVTKKGDSQIHPLPLSSVSRLMAPGAYLIVTGNVYRFMDAYNLGLSGKWVGMDTWKALENEGGILILSDRSGQTVDRVPFGDEMHMELLGDTRGISLERIDPLLPGDQADNWHSAASIAGYATPGEPNSQCAGDVTPGAILEVSPKVFSPDNDGFEDLQEVIVTPGGQDWVIHLMITDLEGRRVRVLANNDLAGTVSVYRWNGESDGGRMVAEGIYLLHGWGYQSTSGKRWRRRISVGVIYR